MDGRSIGVLSVVENNYTPFEDNVWVAAQKVAELRYLEARRLNLGNKSHHSNNDSEWIKKDTLGTIAEIVVGRMMDNAYFPSINTFHKKADIGEDIEIRSTDRENGGLIVRENDDENRRFVLVIVNSDKGYIVRGWSYGYEAKEKGWFWPASNNDKYDAWCYRGPFRPMSELF